MQNLGHKISKKQVSTAFKLMVNSLPGPSPVRLPGRLARTERAPPGGQPGGGPRPGLRGRRGLHPAEQARRAVPAGRGRGGGDAGGPAQGLLRRLPGRVSYFLDYLYFGDFWLVVHNVIHEASLVCKSAVQGFRVKDGLSVLPDLVYYPML